MVKKLDEKQAEQIRVESPIGRLILSARDGAVVSLGLLRSGGEEIPDTSTAEPVLNQAAEQIKEYFNGNRTAFTFAMRPTGTAFQQSVCEELLKIPYGETKTYGEIAKAVENPKGSRAIGMACNKNPIMIAVPCHRVVGADHSLTGYAYGTDLKQQLLEHERRVK